MTRKSQKRGHSHSTSTCQFVADQSYTRSNREKGMKSIEAEKVISTGFPIKLTPVS